MSKGIPLSSSLAQVNTQGSPTWEATANKFLTKKGQSLSLTYHVTLKLTMRGGTRELMTLFFTMILSKKTSRNVSS